MITSEFDAEKDTIRMNTKQVLLGYVIQVSVFLGGFYMGTYWEKSTFLFLYYFLIAIAGIAVGIVMTVISATKYANVFNRLFVKAELLSSEVEALKKKVKELEG